MDIALDGFYTLILATLVLLVGRWLVDHVKFLADYNIPEPVAGGLVAAVVIYVLHAWLGLQFDFNDQLQDAFMLMFFASIGLSADFTSLKAGGIPLVIFLAIVSVYIILQDLIGVGLASALGLEPLMGLVTGSVTLTGGHGTAGAWGSIFEDQYGVDGAVTLGMATATFGLVSGGLIGGPVARFLIRRMNRKPLAETQPEDPLEQVAGKQSLYRTQYREEDGATEDRTTFDDPGEMRRITASSAIETLALFATCLALAELLGNWTEGTVVELPTFVWALGTGVALRNILTHLFSFEMFDRAIDVFGNASLSLFLAMALLSLKLWQLTGLAGPVLVILAVQTVVMMLFATFVTFQLMGRDYDAAVLAAGHCGFGMGATPTAIANMQAITDRFGPSYKAFLIVPMVGAFFVDLVNASILQTLIKLISIF